MKRVIFGDNLDIDATKKLPGESSTRPWPPLIRMEDTVKRKIDAFLKASMPITENRVRI
jgi:3-polyprenyl-4-hydroxybenzoate decarboxylase